jgi:hypothetical protein
LIESNHQLRGSTRSPRGSQKPFRIKVLENLSCGILLKPDFAVFDIEVEDGVLNAA